MRGIRERPTTVVDRDHSLAALTSAVEATGVEVNTVSK